MTHFNPRPPQGERPDTFRPQVVNEQFQSTPPARGATDSQIYLSVHAVISIHAPRKGSDNKSIKSPPIPLYFNPRPPQGERPTAKFTFPFTLSFQSTPPARGATWHGNLYGHPTKDFNPRPPQGERLCRYRSDKTEQEHFNPRPPQGERQQAIKIIMRFLVFQSTPPARGATSSWVKANAKADISIHAPRKGSDAMSVTFNAIKSLFQSTPPARGATI